MSRKVSIMLKAHAVQMEETIVKEIADDKSQLETNAHTHPRHLVSPTEL